MRYWRIWTGLHDTPSRHLVLNGFSRGVPKKWRHRWQQRCQRCLRECLVVSNSTETACSAKHDVQGLPYAVQNPLQLPMDSREGSNVPFNPMTRILLMAYWTSAVMFSGYLRKAGPVIVANAGFWCFNTSGRSLIKFWANTASSCMLKLARSRKSLICACMCRHRGARIEITFALDVQSPRTERTCHSVGTKCSREVGTNSSD